MKKIFLTILFLFIFQACSMAMDKSIRFIQVTDAHFNPNIENTKEILTQTVKDINNQKDIAFVVFTGDNIDKANEKHLEEFMKIVKKIHAPYYLVLGNHDVFKSQNLSKVRYKEIVRHHRIWLHRSWNYSFKKNGYVFIVADGAKEVIPGAAGYYRADTLKWIDKQLTKNADKPVIIFQHYPIIESPEFGKGALRTHRTYQAEKYLDMLSKHDNVIAIVSGHFHVNSEVMQNGVYHINTPTLQKDPPTYKIIDVVHKKGLSPIIYTQLKEVDAQ